MRSNIVDCCAKLLSIASGMLAAIEAGDEFRLIGFFCGRQKKVMLRILAELIENLGRCRTAEDLPGHCQTVVELRNVTFKVLRGLTAREGNPRDQVRVFRSRVKCGFRDLIHRNELLILNARDRSLRNDACNTLESLATITCCILVVRQCGICVTSPCSNFGKTLLSQAKRLLGLFYGEIRSNHSETLSRIDRNFAAQVETLRLASSVRNFQRNERGFHNAPKRSQECDRWCFDSWERLKTRTDLLPSPVTKPTVYEFLCKLRVQREYLAEHGITKPTHFATAVDNGRKCPAISTETPWK